MSDSQEKTMKEFRKQVVDNPHQGFSSEFHSLSLMRQKSLRLCWKQQLPSRGRNLVKYFRSHRWIGMSGYARPGHPGQIK
jgi:hypothetical protein